MQALNKSWVITSRSMASAFGRVVVAVAFAAVTNAAAAAPPERPGPGFAQGRVLVAPAGGLDDPDFHGALAAHGARSRGRLRGMDVHLVDVPPGWERDIVARLGKHPRVKFAEVDERVSIAATVNDPRFASEWHLPKISAPAAWDVSSGAGVTIAVLDTGVDGSHPDLAQQMVPGWNFYDNNSNTADVHGHGTAVAGTAAARSNNAVGIASVAGAARIMPIRISDTSGYGYWSAVAQGLTWAADRGARVANVSFVGVSESSTVQTAAAYFRSRGGVVVVCAGNTGGSSTAAPSGVMLVVGATNETDQRASFSTFGGFVDISAPGTNIVTTSRGGTYQNWNGTSFASPVVAGVAAMVIARRPDLTAEQIEATLLLSAVDLGTAGLDIYFGAGRVDAHAAVQRAAAMPTMTVDAVAPTVAIAAPTGGSVSGTMSVAVNATDNVGISRVELRVNGAVVASRTAAPFTFTWDTRGVANGAATLSATAYDARNNVATSAGVGVSVNNVMAVDTQPPTLVITSPTPDRRVPNVATITTTVSDNSGASGITQLLYIDGKLVATFIGTNLAYKWHTKGVAPGAHTVAVTARDQAGNSTTKSVVAMK